MFGASSIMLPGQTLASHFYVNNEPSWIELDAKPKPSKPSDSPQVGKSINMAKQSSGVAKKRWAGHWRVCAKLID